MIKILTRTLRLNTLVLFNAGKARRDPSRPTEANFIRPFAVNYLQDNFGAKTDFMRVGRGPSSGNG